MILNPKVFRAYDIRGVFAKDFDSAGFLVLGESFGAYLSQKKRNKSRKIKILLTGDGRISMPEIWPAFARGLSRSGCEVVWGGRVPTPINFLVSKKEKFDAGVQITASHNPADENGLKFCDTHGSIAGAEIQKIAAISSEKIKKFQPEFLSADFKYAEKNLRKIYFDSIAESEKQMDGSDEQAKFIPKKIVVDAGNGISGSFFPQMYRNFGHEVIELFCELDGRFPNHQPDPERTENLVDLERKVLETESDLGFAFDGDGDRMGVVLGPKILGKDQTEILSADKIMLALAADFLSRNKNAKIVLDVMSSPTLAEKISEMEGQVVWSPTGHSWIETKMHESGAKLGGEQSGHFMFGENFWGHDDAGLAGLRFLRAIKNHASDLLTHWRKWPQMLEFSEKIPVPESEKFKIAASAARKLTQKFPTADTTDGVRIEFGSGEWAILRASNTSAKIAVRIEAATERSLEEKKKVVGFWILDSGFWITDYRFFQK